MSAQTEKDLRKMVDAFAKRHHKSKAEAFRLRSLLGDLIVALFAMTTITPEVREIALRGEALLRETAKKGE